MDGNSALSFLEVSGRWSGGVLDFLDGICSELELPNVSRRLRDGVDGVLIASRYPRDSTVTARSQ